MGMKDITIKITGKNSIDDQEDVIEFVTDAKIYDKGESLYIIYDESELCGMPGYKTSLKISGQSVKMARYGPNKVKATEMQFENGKRYSNHYATEFGVFDLEILTKNMSNTITQEGEGKLELDYHISLNGLGEARNFLKLEII